MADIASIVDTLSKLTIIEAADLVKKLETAWGVSAAAPVAVAATGGGGAAAAAPNEKTASTIVTKMIKVSANNIKSNLDPNNLTNHKIADSLQRNPDNNQCMAQRVRK